MGAGGVDVVGAVDCIAAGETYEGFGGETYEGFALKAGAT